ncbi:MAG TPA: hypothetical protein VHE78_11820 [Gemmatimonadaceae bacterium]|nr:hypothetical protein [Gemmatimonadaceae bacterium]
MHRTPSGARWWGMVRMLNYELGLPLTLAARAADKVLSSGLAPNRVRISATTDGAMALQLDLQRFLSTSNASLAAAFAFGPTRGRGRPRLTSRQNPVIDQFLSIWEIRVDDEPDKLHRLARQLGEWEAYPRGIEHGLPFIMDAATLRAVPRLALVTNRGDINVLLVSRA